MVSRRKTQIGSTVLKKPKEGLLQKRPVRKAAGKKRVIGVKNPYALADAATHGMTCGWTMRNAETNRKLMEECHGIPFPRLFDPAFRSLLYSPVFFDLVKSKPEKKKDLKLNLGGPKIDPTTCPNDVDHWAIPNPPYWFYEKNPVTGLIDTTKPGFDDPQQGCVPDCYLLAVLGSLAWKQQVICSQANAMSFRDPAGTTWNFGIKTKFKCSGNYSPITWNVPVNAAGDPAIAKSKEKTELWVPVYEKAYACYLEAKQKGKFNGDTPEVWKIPAGDPCFMFLVLTGKIATTHENETIGKYCKTTEETVLEVLTDICQAGTTAPAKKTDYPAVAFTYCTSDPDALAKKGTPLVSIPACAAPAGSGVLYEDDVLVAAHAYSLLGVYEVVTDGVVETWVILRNPYGMDCGACGISQNYTLLEFNYLEFDTFKYPEPVGGGTLPVYKIYNGVFALRLDDFVKWFQGFCWIT